MSAPQTRNIQTQNEPQDIPIKLLEGNFTEQDIELLESWGKKLVNDKVKMSQLRKFFAELKRIQADFDRLKNRIVFLNPQLAYAAGRKKELEGLRKALQPLILNIKGDKVRFDNFVHVFEVIIAYHKLYNGED